jgi:ATP-dependent helicase HrpA
MTDDGVTLVVPELLVDLLDAERLAWLVPGMRLEKLIEVLRALPKSLRKPFVPVPDSARALLADIPAAVDAPLPAFNEWLAQTVTQRAGEPVTPADIATLPLPAHLRMNIRVVDANDSVVAEGRDLLQIRRSLRMAETGAASQGSAANAASSKSEAATTEHREWDFGDLPESVDVERNHLRFRIYPAVRVRGTGVGIYEARSPFEADAISRRGITRLALLALPQQAKFVSQRLSNDRELMLLGAGLSLTQPLPQALTWRAALECFLPDDTPLPRSREAFDALLESRRGDLADVADKLAASVREILKEWRQVRVSLDNVRRLTPAAAATIDAELSTLLPPDFIESTPREWLAHFPRYLKAVRRRLERLPSDTKRDAELAARIRPFANALRTMTAEAPLSRPRPELQQLRWMIEEFRVSLFAQEMRTVLRVSERRLGEQLEKARVEARA